MAYIYRYRLGNRELREEFDLREYENISGKTFTNIIRNNFKGNLKSMRVYKDYLEFRLYRASSEEKLDRIFDEVERKCHSFSMDIDLYIKQNNLRVDDIFRPIRNSYYALIHNNPESRFIELELFDAWDFSEENIENFTKKCKERFLDASKRDPEDLELHNLEALYRYYGMDILTASIRKDNLDRFIWDIDLEDIEDGDLVLIKGNLRKLYGAIDINDRTDILVKNELDIILNIDALEVKNRMHKLIKDVERDYENRIEIHKIERLNFDEKNRLRKLLDLQLKKVNKFKIKDKYKNHPKELDFKVYDVGHAQSTSLSFIDEDPFMFFDFGLLDKENHKKANKKDLNLYQLETIILSHLHKDHWSGVYHYREACYSDWLIPKQKTSLIFNKLIAAILKDTSELSGRIKKNQVYFVDENIDFNFGRIFMPLQISKKDMNLRAGENKNHVIEHQTGIGLKLNLLVDKEEVDILVVGDQQYDFIANEYLVNNDILVATHHGGSYTWEMEEVEFSEAKDLEEIPRNSKDGLLIISCSELYNNPSKLDDYIQKGWLNHHITKDKGLFSLRDYYKKKQHFKNING